jgi:hypothetical protein
MVRTGGLSIRTSRTALEREGSLVPRAGSPFLVFGERPGDEGKAGRGRVPRRT